MKYPLNLIHNDYFYSLLTSSSQLSPRLSCEEDSNFHGVILFIPVLCSIQTLQGRLSFIKYIQWMILICFIICIFLHFRKNWLIYYKDGKIIIFQAEPKLMYRVTIYWIFYWRIQWRFKKVFIIHNFETMGLIVISQIFCFFWYGLCNIVKAIHPAESVTSRKKFNECIF